jgi:anti-sigma factor RsiW
MAEDQTQPSQVPGVPAGIPPYVWFAVMALGLGSGSLGGLGTASASVTDLERVEAKVDALNDRVTEIKIAIARMERTAP